MKRVRAPQLKRQTRIKIGEYKEKNPDVNMREIADLFNCTYDQARTAIEKYFDGSLIKKRKKTEPAVEIDLNKEPTEIFEKQYRTALVQLDNNKDLPADQRVFLLEKLTKVQKSIQSVKLQNHIKKTDADIIAIIIRKFKPDASNEDIIMIYEEALATWKNSQD